MDATKGKSNGGQPQTSRIQQPSAASGWSGSGFGWQLDDGTEDPKITIQDINPHAKPDESAFSIFPIAERQNFNMLREEHLRKRTLFEDPEFPTTMKSLRYSPLDAEKDMNIRAKYENIVWLRPTEIVKLNDPSAIPHFSVDGYSRFDIIQGILGDCWAIAVMSNLTQWPHLFIKVVPDDQSFRDKYAGIFHFRFWQYGKWADVVIDDRLPTYDGKLTFVKSTAQNEFWIALLEKAYAKLYGSYEAITAGVGGEAMQDFTGGYYEMYLIEEIKKNKDIFKMLLVAFERSSLLSASIVDTPDEQWVHDLRESYGLITGHEYSITSVKYIETSNPQEKIVPLLRLRNPWGGTVEWKQAWSDNDTAKWATVSKDVQKEIGFKVDHDGEFWMSYQDFVTYFTQFDICNLTLDRLSKEEMSKGKKWDVSMIEGAWVNGVTAGGSAALDKNPQYLITLTERDEDDKNSKCTLLISLMQKHRRAMKQIGAGNLSIGYCIYSLKDLDQIPKPLDNSFFSSRPTPDARSPRYGEYRELNCRFEVPPGTWCIIPFTLEPQFEGSFILRVFTVHKNHVNEYDDDIRLEDLDNQISTRSFSSHEQVTDNETMEMFLKVAKRKLEINWLELKAILDSAMNEDTKGTGFSEDVCRSIVALSDHDHSGKLGYGEFRKLWIDIKNWKAVFKSQDKDNRMTISGYQLREALLSIGYHVTKRILIDLMHRYGNKDHAFNFELFILCALKVKAMLALFNWKFDDTTKTANFRLDEWMDGTLNS